MLFMHFVYKCQLKELEKLGPRKGVISQSVKDVVQSLVDDDLVSKDKIGTSVRIVSRWVTNQYVSFVESFLKQIMKNTSPVILILIHLWSNSCYTIYDSCFFLLFCFSVQDSNYDFINVY